MHSDARSSYRGARLEEWLLAAALSLTTATQLRFASVGFGIGEVVVSLWCLVTIVRNYDKFSYSYPKAVATACGIMLICLLVGLWSGVAHGMDVTENVRDIIAYSANLVLLLGLGLGFYDPEKARRTFVKLGICLLIVNGLASFLAQSDISVGNLNLRMADSHRLYGFSTNPNQISLGCSITLAAIFLLQWPRRTFGRRVVQVAMVAATLYIGYLCDSDALKLAVFAFFAIYIGMGAFAELSSKSLSHRFVGVALIVLTTLAAGVVLFFTTDIGERTVSLVSGFYYAEDDQGDVRVTLWRNGLRAFVESNLLGFGPGAFSGLAGPFEGLEAHNSFIDLACSAGLGGFGLLIVILGQQIYKNLRAQPLVAAFIIMIVIQMSFNFFLRHFVLWTSIILICALARAVTYTPLRPWARPARGQNPSLHNIDHD